jgi:serine/threonine protein phosphatase PrpC
VGNLEEKGGFSKKDNGKQAYENEHVIEDYDIVIMASDGMWDNLYIRDISICV